MNVAAEAITTADPIRRVTGKSPKARLEDYAREALAESPNDFAEALAAFRAEVSDDAGALVELIGAALDSHCRRFLNETSAKLSGRVRVREHLRWLHAVEAQENGGGQRIIDARNDDAAPAPRVTPEQRIAGNIAAARRIAASVLDTYKIDGVPLRLCTRARAEAKAASDERSAKFLRLIIEPLVADEQVIGEFIRDDEAAQCWERAASRDGGPTSP